MDQCGADVLFVIQLKELPLLVILAMHLVPECKYAWLILASFLLGWTCFGRPPSIFVQTGYSIYTLRQASRRSWRIGQRSNVVVHFLTHNETMQTSCLRLMGKMLLFSLAMEGKFSNEVLQGIEDDDDVLTAMVRELIIQRG
jgi:hypothetical protein